MKMLLPERVQFKGPDPPPEDWVAPSKEATIEQPAAPAKKGAKKEEVPPPEPVKSPEVEAADKLVRKFMKQFMTGMLDLQNDLNTYR